MRFVAFVHRREPRDRQAGEVSYNHKSASEFCAYQHGSCDTHRKMLTFCILVLPIHRISCMAVMSVLHFMRASAHVNHNSPLNVCCGLQFLRGPLWILVFWTLVFAWWIGSKPYARSEFNVQEIGLRCTH